MKKGISIMLLLVCAWAFSGCVPGKLEPGQYLKTLAADEALNKSVVVGNIRYTFHLVTPEAIAIRYSADEAGRVDRGKYDARLAEIKGNLYVDLSHQVEQANTPVLRYKLGSPAEYEQRVMYYEFEAQKDISVLYDGQEMKATGYLYENHNDLSPQNNLIATFPVKPDAKDIQVVFNDRAFNNLFVKVTFRQSDINTLPHLVLN